MRLLATTLLAALIAAGCGTGEADITIDEPPPTLFDDTESALDGSSSTADPEAVAVAPLDPAELPTPRSGVRGVVVVDGVALAVDEVLADGWMARSPCGTAFSGDEPIRQALVVLDPAGDARLDDGVAPLVLNHAIVDALAAELDAVGVTALVTRTGTADVSAAVRSAAASASGAVVVVSMAFAAGDGPATDTAPLEVVHPASDARGRRLAGLVHQTLAPALEEIETVWVGGVEPGVRAVLNQRGADYFTMLREHEDQARVVAHLPALTVDRAGTFPSSSSTVTVIADALAEAITRYLLTDEQGDGFVVDGTVVRDAPTASGVDTCVEPLAVGSSAAGEGG